MAADIEPPKLNSEQSRKRKRFNHVSKLLPNDKAEVRSIEDGFQGSWHSATVIDKKNQIRVIKYDLFNGQIESIPIIPTNQEPSKFPNNRCRIRPVPPRLIRNKNYLHYGQCVDVFHDNVWWEGVVFDHDHGCEERLVFFPDLGDEIRARFENIRFTQDWDANTGKWKLRGDWVFLQVLEELELEHKWPILVSVKQIWYDVRNKNRFVKDMIEWTCLVTEKWEEVVKDVIFDHFSLTIKDFFKRLNSANGINEPVLKKNLDLDDENGDSGSGPPGFSNLDLNSYKLATDLPDCFTIPGPNLVPQPECFPDSVAEYYNGLISGNRPSFSTTIKVRQHLLFLGWKIECKKRVWSNGRNPTITYRYTDPNGKQYYSLKDVCKDLKNYLPETETKILGSFDSDKQELKVESLYFSQTVIDYHLLALKESYNLRKYKKDSRFRGSDYICSVCHYGGELVLCDKCPSSFHTRCLGLKEVPDGKWFCPSCCCGICNKNGYGEHVEQNTDSRIRCCKQCERIYHIGCLKRSRRLAKLENNYKKSWFCSSKCKEIFTGLERLLGKSIRVGKDNLRWTLLKYKKIKCCNRDLSEMKQLMEIYNKLNVVVKVMHECFNPVKEPLTQRDIVEDVIFSRRSDLNRLNFKGFYTILLEKNDELISAATMRVYGEKVAELPFVGTRIEYRRRGMCHILMNELEKNLMELGIERVVLPAASSVLQTWTKSFGFSIMTKSEQLEFIDYTFLNFQGTIMCHKHLMTSQNSRGNSCDAINEVDTIDQRSPGNFQGNVAANNVSGTSSVEILADEVILVECESKTSLESDMKECEGHK